MPVISVTTYVIRKREPDRGGNPYYAHILSGHITSSFRNHGIDSTQEDNGVLGRHQNALIKNNPTLSFETTRPSNGKKFHAYNLVAWKHFDF